MSSSTSSLPGGGGNKRGWGGGQWPLMDLRYWSHWAQESLSPRLPELVTQPINLLIGLGIGNSEETFTLNSHSEQLSAMTGLKEISHVCAISSWAAVCLLPTHFATKKTLAAASEHSPNPFSFYSFPSVFV